MLGKPGRSTGPALGRGREPKLDRHEDGLMLTLLLETWNHHRSHAVLRMSLRMRESRMSVQGWRRTPRNDVGEMLNHTQIVITVTTPRNETRSGRG